MSFRSDRFHFSEITFANTLNLTILGATERYVSTPNVRIFPPNLVRFGKLAWTLGRRGSFLGVLTLDYQMPSLELVIIPGSDVRFLFSHSGFR